MPAMTNSELTALSPPDFWLNHWIGNHEGLTNRVYRDPVYDRFWAAASDAGAPITLHLLTGRVLSPLGGATDQTPVERQENPAL